MRVILEKSRYLGGIAALSSLALAIVAFVWSAVTAIDLVHHLVVEDGWEDADAIAELLAVVDLLLIGTTLIVLAYGLWELFVSEVTSPPWLQIASLDDLKKKVADLIVLVIAVKLFEKILVAPRAEDALYYGLAVALVGGTLIVFSSLRGKSKP